MRGLGSRAHGLVGSARTQAGGEPGRQHLAARSGLHLTHVGVAGRDWSEPVRRELLLGARLLPLIVGSLALGAPAALAAKGAAELDAGFYLKSLLRGPEANRDDEYFSASPMSVAESPLGPPDERVAIALVEGALDAVAVASGDSAAAVRALACGKGRAEAQPAARGARHKNFRLRPRAHCSLRRGARFARHVRARALGVRQALWLRDPRRPLDCSRRAL
jgi:hypothetical protein